MEEKVTIWQKIEMMLDKCDGDLDLKVGTSAMWSGQLRITLHDREEGKPAHSTASL